MLDNNSFKSILGVHYEEPAPASNLWMVSLADLVSLLLVFFILMYATSSVKQGGWDKVKESIGNQFHTDKKLDDGAFNTKFTSTKIQMMRGMDLDYLYAVLSNKINEDEFLSGHVGLENTGDKLIISLKTNDIFDDSNPILSQFAEPILYSISDNIQKINNKIEVIGYSPKKAKGMLPKEWRLALEHAIVLAGELRKYGNSSNIEAIVKEPSEEGDVTDSKIEIIIHEMVK
ncbi:MAG: chemotaxis protein MotB [Rickettsiaceae bacterium]|jgi:chemotaxis protein MotB|nr:chemotaxis protein MotB [Rickettsiaceae bacterium]